MIFTKRSRKGSTNSASSSSIATNKTKNPHLYPVEDQKSVVQRRHASLIRLKIRPVGPIIKSRTTIPSAPWKMSDEEDEEESDFHGQLASEEWPSNHGDEGDDSCRWLSSGNTSPSCCFDDKIFANLLELSLDDWLVSVLIFCNNSSSPVFGRATSFFDGSSVTPLEEASSILTSSSEEEIFDEEITTWLMNSLEADKLSAQSYQDSNVCNHFVYFSNDDFEVPEIWDFDEGLLESFLDLEDGENLEWISDDALNFLQIDFPSPSDRSSWSSDTSQSSDFVSYGKNFAPAESTNTEIDEPIFWPFLLINLLPI